MNHDKKFWPEGLSAMNTKVVGNSLIKQWSAWLPIAMSLAALALVLVHAAIIGIIHEADEGAAAHIFQILMAFQLPVIAFFAFKWLPKQPKKALQVLALQAGAGIAAFISVYFLT
jgi:hypothetical protein